VAEPSYPLGAHDYASEAEEHERLEAALEGGPRGALAVSGIAVALLLIGWLGLYFIVFLSRGPVG